MEYPAAFMSFVSSVVLSRERVKGPSLLHLIQNSLKVIHDTILITVECSRLRRVHGFKAQAIEGFSSGYRQMETNRSKILSLTFRTPATAADT